MLWFGEPWPSAELRAPICEDDAQRVLVPVGRPCVHCDEEIVSGDRGEVYGGGQPAHAECGLRNILGNHIHVRGDCPALGECNRMSTLTYRQEALKVWAYVIDRACLRCEEGWDAHFAVTDPSCTRYKPYAPS